jgi:hypothetical protein
MGDPKANHGATNHLVEEKVLEQLEGEREGAYKAVDSCRNTEEACSTLSKNHIMDDVHKIAKALGF